MTFNMPPGCSPSSPGGPDDPIRLASQEAEEKLYNGFYAAQMAGFSVQEICQVWREAAEEAHFDEEESDRREAEMWDLLDRAADLRIDTH